MLKIVYVLLLASLSLSAFAQTKELRIEEKRKEISNDISEYDKKYFKISNIVVTDVTNEMKDLNQSYVVNNKDRGITDIFDQIIGVTKSLIAFGSKIYDIVNAGKPTVNLELAPASVLPNTTDSTPSDVAFDNMFGWSFPEVKSYNVRFENGFGAPVIIFDYNLYFQHSGKYEGKGKYLTGVKVTPTNVHVAWAHDLDARSKVIAVSNVGNSVEDPVAGLTMEIEYTIENPASVTKSTDSFFITGDGKVIKM